MSMASAVMHGLQLGGSQAQMEWERQQQMGALMRHLAEQRATQQLNAQQLNQFLPPPPMQPMQTPLGESGGAIDLGQQVQPVDPHAEFRAAFADAPPEGQQHVLGGYQAAQRTSMVGQAQQRLEQEQFDKDMGEITAARKIGFSPEHDNLDQVPGVLAKYHKYGIPTKNPQPYSQEMVGGAMKRDPMAVAQMLNRGSMPPGLMPSANAPGQIDEQDAIDRENPDPAISGPAKARIMQALGARSMGAVDVKRPGGKAPPATPEEIDAQVQDVVESLGGEDNVTPRQLAEIRDAKAHGRALAHGFFASLGVPEAQAARGAAIDKAHRVTAAQNEVNQRWKFVQQAVKLAGGDKKKAEKENPQVFGDLNAAKQELAKLNEGGTATQPKAPKPVGGAVGPSGAAGISKERAVDQAWSELGRDADPAAVKARVQELMGGGR
jgi:hypothetical protein